MNMTLTQAEADRLNSTSKLRKLQAKNLRDDDDVPGAVRVLLSAIQELESNCLKNWESEVDHIPAAVPVQVQAVAFQLADCIGMLGGNYRRLNRLEDAQIQFDRGSRLEAEPAFGIMSSYNTVNAVTLPLECGMLSVADQTDELRRAVGTIERQVRGVRRPDRWAWADLGQCHVLLGDVERAIGCYRHALMLGDDATVQSIRPVLERLRAALTPRDAAAAERIAQVLQALPST
jgi:tetratricopeptide (TPR) repeat protein